MLLRLQWMNKKSCESVNHKTPDWTGRKHKKETKKKIGDKNKIAQTGTNNSQFGTIWITNEHENRKIKKTECIPEGWCLGRKMKR